MPGRSQRERVLWLLLVSSAVTMAGVLLNLSVLLRTHSAGSPLVIIGIAVVAVEGALLVAVLLRLRNLRRRKG